MKPVLNVLKMLHWIVECYNPTPALPAVSPFCSCFLRISARLRKFGIVRQVSCVPSEWVGIGVICALIVLC